ncbi:MAG: YdiU family protein [Thiotrichales bacterium]
MTARSRSMVVMLDTLRFNNRFTGALPADPVTDNFRRQVEGACYSRVEPQRVVAPELVAYSREVVELLGIPAPDTNAALSAAFVAVFSGNQLLPGMDPFAMCYGGHQFGAWAGQLGDGRAINLGELVNPRGEHYTLQLKGAGPTPYSRRADGLAVLRSSVREFLCSEAMHHLGVPTTRALSLVTTGEPVVRDMFYDGNPEEEPGAIVCRVAPSFLRFGSFEIFSARRDFTRLKQLVDFTLRTDFPHLGAPGPDTYAVWFDEICQRTAALLVHWMRVGFVHGVMNTDNMSILGLTIDYGPYGWLEDYDPDWTPNTTDAQGRRYRFGNQPSIALWNLAQLGNALAPLLEDIAPLQAAVDRYKASFRQLWQAMMAQKLGLDTFDAGSDPGLFGLLDHTLRLAETDMTIVFRCLAEFDPTFVNDGARRGQALLTPLLPAFYQPDRIDDDTAAQWDKWLREYAARLQRDGRDPAARKASMNAVNPRFVLRNYLAQIAIDAATQGDFGPVNELLDVMRRPYDEQPGRERFAEKRPEWARHRAGCSMLSCSS